MSRYTKEDIFRLVEEEDVEFIRLQFTDIFGVLKNAAITSGQLKRALNNRCMFDGSVIEGFVRIEESDMYLYPDLDTFEIFPWRPQQGKVARLICDVRRPGGQPFEGDPRYVLKQAIKEAADMGYEFHVGPECELFLFHTDDEGNPTTNTHEKGSYFDVGPLDLAENVRRDIVLALEDMGFEIEASYHEMSHGQHEIDIQSAPALEAADKIMTFKMAVKNIAKRHGLHATFMPQPVEGTNGSGLHLNMYLTDKSGKNVFEDLQDKLGLSKTAYQFIAGLLEHSEEIALLTNPLINSYKRLIPSHDAPNYIAWSEHSNRSALIRIPPSEGENTRIELRSPDSAANPYLVLAACLAAGLDGIRKNLEPAASVDENIYAMSKEERRARGIKTLPESLEAAVKIFRKSRFSEKVLGSHIFSKYLEAKEKEWNAFRVHVTDWEVKEYLRKY